MHLKLSILRANQLLSLNQHESLRFLALPPYYQSSLLACECKIIVHYGQQRLSHIHKVLIKEMRRKIITIQWSF